MKKFLCLILCVIFTLSLTACGKDNNKNSNHDIDVEYYAKMGKISGVDYKIGADVDDVKATLELTVDDHDESNYFDYESGEYTVMTDGSVCACYKTDDKSSGITHVVKYGDVYGFSAGAVSTLVRDTMSDTGFDATEREAKIGELFFLPAGADMTVLEYKIKDYTVLFVFQEHALSAAVISK